MIPFDLVYVVDDEKFDRLLYKRVIEKSGLVGSLELYPDAESALKALQDTTRSPDLILLEINMPRMTGFDFLDAVDEQLTLSDPGSACLIEDPDEPETLLVISPMVLLPSLLVGVVVTVDLISQFPVLGQAQAPAQLISV